ncbi:MAG TPA: hypothetical protein VL986_00845 [Terracidiphilus sp.]|nr:hypothetical protein [Terracidiphilus sp.]
MKHEFQSAEYADAIDRILAADEELVPSSGFLAGVMERVRDEAIAPRPIPFPWKLALPGMVLAAGTIGWLIYEFIRTVLDSAPDISFAAPRLASTTQMVLSPVVWIAFALALSLGSWALARRIARNYRVF